MRWFDVRLIETVPCDGDIVTCRFERPEGYDFRAGQYCLLELDTASGKERKPFTIASAPGDGWLEFTTRVSASAFKQALRAAGPGALARVSPPAGRLVLPPGTGTVVFLVGGVGITPAHSILRDAMQRGSAMRATLFYGIADLACAPYRDEFESMPGQLLRTVFVVEHPADGWQGETGYVDAGTVRRHLGTEPDVWIVAGPPPMVEAMERVLDELEVPGDRRLIERFSLSGVSTQ